MVSFSIIYSTVLRIVTKRTEDPFPTSVVNPFVSERAFFSRLEALHLFQHVLFEVVCAA